MVPTKLRANYLRFHVWRREKLKIFTIMLTVKPCWLLVSAAYEIGEVCVDITLEHFQKPFGEEKKNATKNEEEKEENAHSTNYPEPISAIINHLSSLRDGIQCDINIQKPETDADNKKEMKISSDVIHSENQSPLSQTTKHLWFEPEDFDTEEETQDHLDKHTIAKDRMSPSHYFTPLSCTQLGPTTIVCLPSTLRSRIRAMIDSVTRDLKSEERHKAVRLIIETEQYVEKLFLKSQSNMQQMVEHMEGLKRRLKENLKDAEITKVENRVRSEDEDGEEEMESGILTPSTSSDDWTPVEPPSTSWARFELTFED